MSETEQLIAALRQSLAARLAFRRQPLIDAIQAVKSKATKNGNINSGRIGITIAVPYGEEARQRAELVCAYLKEARMEWSPSALIEAEDAIRSSVLGLFKENLSEAAQLVADMGTITQKRNHGLHWAAVAISYDNETNAASVTAVAMVQSAITEIVQSARTAVHARSREERPQFMFNNTFTGPIGGVAQGEASIGSISQSNSSAWPDQIKELARLILEARAELGSKGSKETAAALQVVEAEAGSEEPDWGIVRAATARVCGFLERAGSGAAGGALLAFARAHGWFP